MSHISSAYRLLTTCVYVHVRKGAREVLGKPVSDFQVQSYYIYFWRVQEMRVIASYCELAAIDLHMLTYICVGLRKIKVSDGFRMFQMVSEGVGFQVSGFRWFQKE